jgi:hypothetical protein
MSLSEDLREFADVVELLEEHGVEVQGAPSIQTDVEGELICGELTVLVATDTEISVDATATVADDDVDPDDPLEDDVQADDDRDDGGGVPCPECDRTFDDVRAMKNHRARAHEGGGLDVGDSELWCGICQKGPMTDHGLKSHHGRMHGGEDLDPVTDPPEEWLDEDDDVPPHHDPGRLREAYEAADGVIADTAEQLDVDVTTGAVRYQLIQHGIHDPDGDQDAGNDEDQEDYEDDVDEEDVATEDEADPQPVVTNGGGQVSEPESDSDSGADTADVQEDVDVDPDDPLEAHGVAEGDLVDAIAGAQSVHYVQRELNVSRDVATELIAAAGLLEKLSTGCPPVDEAEARRGVQEVSA